MAEELKVIITADDRASNVLKGIGSAITNIGKIALGAGVAGFAGLTAGIGASIKSAMEAEKIDAQLNAVLKSTGGQAGITKNEILKLSDALSKVTPFEDEMITATQTVLLQFKNLNKDVFPQTTKLSLDLAQRLGVDAKSAALMLGKALETPGEGLMRLKAAGVAFNDEQEKMIKKMVESGDTAGAQKLIMQELEKSIGGAAEAAGNTFAGQLEIAKNQIGNVAENIGTLFLPKLTELAKEANTKVIPALAGIFPALQEGWDKNDWSKLAGTLNLLLPADASKDIATFVGRITDGLKTGDWEPVKKAFWEWLTGKGGITEQVSEKFKGLAASFSGWVSGEGSTQLIDVGKSIGRLIFDGISQLFAQDKDAQNIVGQNLIIGLQEIVRGIGQGIFLIGWGIAEEMAKGLFALFMGRQIRDDTQVVFDNLGNWMARTVFDPGSWGRAFSDLIDFLLTGNKGFTKFATPSKLPGFQTAPGEFRVVPGGINEAVPAIVHGGEVIGRPSLGGAGGIVVNLTYAPALSLADEREFQERLMPFIERGITNARSRQIGAAR